MMTKMISSRLSYCDAQFLILINRRWLFIRLWPGAKACAVCFCQCYSCQVAPNQNHATARFQERVVGVWYRSAKRVRRV